MLFNQKKNWFAIALTALAFISTPALADNDDDNDDDDDRPRVTRVHQSKAKSAKSAVKISSQRARSIAQAHYPSAQVSDVDLERKRGRAYYEVDLEDRRYDYKVKIDANTGKVIHKSRKRDNND